MTLATPDSFACAAVYRNGHSTASANEPLVLRQAPHNLEAEKALLGAILLNNDALDWVSGFLSPDHFFDPLHGRIYETALKLRCEGRPVTPTILKTFFEDAEPVKPGMTVPQYLGHLTVNATTIINAAEYGRTICDLATRRALIITCEDAIKAAYDTSTDISPAALIANHDAAIDRVKSGGSLLTAGSLLEFAENAGLDDERDDLISGAVPPQTVGLLYSGSGLGKTFVGVHALKCIARGEAFFGRRTRESAGLYIALEGRGRFGRRLRAAVSSAGLPPKRVARLLKGITLGRGAAVGADVSTIIEAVKALAKAAGLPVGLIVIDIAKALAGDNENEAAAISAVMAQAGRIAENTGAAVLIVHHPGKDTERGMRGSSSLFADADFVLRIDGEKGPGEKALVLEKSKDDEEGPLGSFTLEKVVVGTDRHGDDITSLIVRGIDGSPVDGQRKRPKRPKPETAAGRALTELEHLVFKGKCQKFPNHDRIPPNVSAVEQAAWKEACHRKGLTPTETPSAKNKAFERAHSDMSRAGLIGTFEGWVWLIGDSESRASR